MNMRILSRGCAVLLGLAVSLNAAAGCGHDHKSYPEGGIACVSHRQLICGKAGAWHAMAQTAHCDADPPPAKTTPDPGKDKAASTSPGGG